MTEGIRGVSLLPFLDRNPGTFHLRFPLASQDPEALSHSAFPFLLVSESDPIARVVAASVDTDAGDRVASLFFLVQKDRYRLGRESLHPVTNVDVEKAWQCAGAAYRNVGKERAPRFFDGQLDNNGILSPFAPLFFCKEKGRYFHPPCPRCGRPLSLCVDDAALAAAGLPLYSKSLDRCLYCEACAGSPGGSFYAMEAGSGAPAILRDRITLVREFGKAGSGSAGESGFPCPACPEREACFGPSLKALSRIVPFSFYPFHAFAFDAMSLCAPDFLALLSGAVPEALAKRLESEGERGRAALVRAAGDGAPILFERGERRFLEVLYLKLTLLGDLIGALPTGGSLGGPPEFRPSVDRAWVALGAARELLPRFWNFRATVLDVGRYGEDDASPDGSPGRDALTFLGVAWFEALLVNPGQDGIAVRRALSERLRHPSGGVASPFPGARDPESPFFAGNLLFEPTGEPLSNGTAELWEAALSTGWSILRAGSAGEPGAGAETIAAEIGKLRARVRERLFESPSAARQPAKPEPVSAGKDDEAAIAEILDGILRKWTGDAAAAGAPPPPPPPPKASPPRPRPAPPAPDDFLVKTVVLGAHPPGPARPPGPPLIAADPAPDDAIEKTMILRPGDVSPAPPAADDFLDKTVILGPAKSGIVPPSPERAKDAGEPEPPAAPEPEGDVDLEKTVILKPPPDSGKFRRHGR